MLWRKPDRLKSRVILREAAVALRVGAVDAAAPLEGLTYDGRHLFHWLDVTKPQIIAVAAGDCADVNLF